ncbi:MAG: hypothetical protein LBL90_06900 [Prevotellaceae bacterium]|jgi:hypothetical protein|nr:hypothetical protein [Prevotellaceae bacterium]
MFLKVPVLFATLFFIFSETCDLKAQSDIDTVEVTRCLQKKYNFKNPVEILQHISSDDDEVYVFRIDAKDTKLHKYLKNIYKNRFGKKKTNIFSSQYEKFFIPEHFLHIFVPVFKYQGNYYLYQPCDFLFSFKLTDSYFAPAYMDGAYAYPIVAFIKDHVNSINVATGVQRGEYSIDLFDGIGKIYRLKIDGKFAGYFTPLDNLGELGIIAEDCYNQGAIFRNNFEWE